MPLTPEQQSAIEAQGPEVLVVAGAGSGKTHVLVERYLSLLAEPDPANPGAPKHQLSQIVAVTFTELAATEMRERVRRELASRPELADRRALLDEAPIGTIHSLCHRILLEHAAEAGIDPASRILGEDEAESQVLMACVDVLEEASTDERLAPAILELSDEGGPENVVDVLTDLVRSRDDTRAAFNIMGTTARRAFPPLEARKGAAAHEQMSSVIESTVEDFEVVALAGCAEGTLAVREELLRLGAALDDAFCSDTSDTLYPFFDGAQSALASLSTDVDRFRTEAQALVELLSGVGSRGSAKKWTPSPKDVRHLLTPIRELAKTVDDFAWNEHDGRAVEAIFALRDVFENACEMYEARKRSSSALDYLDLEILTRDLLLRNPDVPAVYHGRFRHILIDEFQDTNPIQVEIIGLLAGDGRAKPPVDRFYVGDAKQAVYRFRGGDVRGFKRAGTRLEAKGEGILPLSKSFRTHGGLVGTVNEVFERVFESSEAEYEASMEPLTGRDDEAPPGPHTTVMTVANPVDGTKANSDEKTRLEAHMIAEEIAELLGSGREVWDRDGGMRPVRPSDIAILLRRFTKVRDFEDALAALEVPFHAHQGAGFFQRPEVVDLANLLGWLAEPDDSVALAGALRSPLFLIDDPTLFTIRENRRPFILGLREPPAGVQEPARSTCQRAAATLDELTELAAGESVDVVIARALALTGFEASWAAVPGGEQALANIGKLLNMARSLRSQSIDEFVTYLVRRRDELTTRESQAVLDRADAVRILTVHGSKGLEFPVVFVGEAHMANRSPNERLLVSRERGVSMTLPRDDDDPKEGRAVPGFYRFLQKGEQAEDIAEFRRLFYVACTRAGDYLYLTGEDPGNRSRDRWLDWALPALGDIDGGRVEIREPRPVDVGALKRVHPEPEHPPPDEASETDYTAPLLARPPVIPVRSSTPVTSLLAAKEHPVTGHGDGLAAFRGTVAHRAVELTYGTRDCPPIRELVVQLQDRPLSAEDVDRVAGEVEGYLERFAESDLGKLLASEAVEARYEVPFAWDWDGVPVHGTIDLVYQDGDGGWHVVDFKTDVVNGRSPDEAAEPYLAQLGLYGMAVERAVGARPSLALAFLRSGAVHGVEWAGAEPAVGEARERVDAGAALVVGEGE